MNIATQRELLRRFFELRAAHTTSLAPAPYRQNASVYTDPERLANEERLLLRGRPLVAALSADVPSTGDCLATEVAGVPILLIRGEDAEVRAFLNICRHRGGRVFAGRGRPGRALKCPYHSWAYDLNGDLLGQPLARDAFESVDRCELGLRPVAVGERFGLILVRLGGESKAPIDVEHELCGLGAELGEWEFGNWHFRAQPGVRRQLEAHPRYVPRDLSRVLPAQGHAGAGHAVDSLRGGSVRRARPRTGDAQGGREPA